MKQTRTTTILSVTVGMLLIAGMVDAQTGGSPAIERAWAISPGDIAACVARAGSVWAFTQSGLMLQFSQKDGGLLSTIKTDEVPAATPLVDAGSVIIAATDGSVSCRTFPDGNLLWRRENIARQFSSPVMHNGALYIGTGEGGPALWRFDAATGVGDMVVALQRSVLSPPAFAGENAFIATAGGQVIRIDLKSKTVAETLQTGGMFVGQPIVPVKGTLLISPTGEHRRVECVAAAALGKRAWGISFERPWYADVMALAEAACARPEARGELLAKALANSPDSGLGKRFNAASDFIPAGPAITSGWTLSGSRAAVVVEEGGYPPQAMATLLLVDADSGRELLRHAEIVRGTPGMMVPAPVFAGQNVIAALGPNKLIGLSSATGTTEWEYPMPDGVAGPLMLAGNMLFVRTQADSIVAFRIAPTLMLPGAFALSQNMPNPFRRITVLHFAVPKNVEVSLRIFSGNGTLVKTIVDEKKNAGWYSVTWNGSDDKNRQAAAGVYLAKFNAGRYVKTIRMNLVR